MANPPDKPHKLIENRRIEAESTRASFDSECQAEDVEMLEDQPNSIEKIYEISEEIKL